MRVFTYCISVCLSVCMNVCTYLEEFNGKMCAIIYYLPCKRMSLGGKICREGMQCDASETYINYGIVRLYKKH